MTVHYRYGSTQGCKWASPPRSTTDDREDVTCTYCRRTINHLDWRAEFSLTSAAEDIAVAILAARHGATRAEVEQWEVRELVVDQLLARHRDEFDDLLDGERVLAALDGRNRLERVREYEAAGGRPTLRQPRPP